MKYHSKLLSSRFLKRENRFSATVLLDGKKHYVHVPNSGRLKELLTPQREVFLLPAKNSAVQRKTAYSLALSRYGSCYVSLEAAKANDLFEEAMTEGVITEFSSYKIIGREKRIGMSRIDFLLEDKNLKSLYVEVKSVTLVIDDTSMFPDAPTKRGAKHLKELIELKRKGSEAAVVFVIQRPDACRFSPNDYEDPQFGILLREAFKEGVRIIAYRCYIDLNEIYITKPVPIIL